MLEGFYTAASGILMQQRNLATLTNNMANSRTPGYRAERVVCKTFEQEYLTRIEQGNTGAIGTGAPIQVISTVSTDFSESSLEETGRALDFALVGPGYFNVEDAEGNQYMTRNGQFEMDADGYLVLPNGAMLMGWKQGAIQLKNTNFTVTRDGEIYDDRDRLVDTLMVTMPGTDANGEQILLEKAVNGMYTVPNFENNVRQYHTDGLRVEQGQIERPNIDFNREYTMVMEAQRAFQACSSALKIIDGVNQKTATQITSL